VVLTSSPALIVSPSAKQHAADFGFFEVQSQAVEAAGKLDHFVEHDIAQAFHFGRAVTDLADDAHVGLGDGGLEAGDLGFNLLKDVAHRSFGFGKVEVEGGKRGNVRRVGRLEVFETGFDGAVPDVTADADAHAAEQFGFEIELEGQLAAILGIEAFCNC
jgi:hypothetical protein